MPHPIVLVVLLGAAVGFLGGLLGKGGSALATPFLVALGIPPMVALAAPLPATVPGTLLAADRYRRAGLIERGHRHLVAAATAAAAAAEELALVGLRVANARAAGIERTLEGAVVVVVLTEVEGAGGGRGRDQRGQ